MKFKTFVSSVAMVLLIINTDQARGGFDYRYAFDQVNYSGDPGGSVVVQVFLEETVNAGSVSRLATDGLIGAGVRVLFDTTPVPSDPSGVLVPTDIFANTAAFDDPFGPIKGLVVGSYAELTETVDITTPPVLATMVAQDTFRILLGSFRFTVGTSLGQVTTIQAIDIPDTSDTITGVGMELDRQISSARATILVRGVPEPGSLMLLAVGSLYLTLIMRCRR